MDKNVLKENLQSSIAYVSFIKTDGTLREMKCTLIPSYLPEPKQIDENVRHVPRKESDDSLAVWDIEKSAWRSFRLDSINNINYIGVENAASA